MVSQVTLLFGMLVVENIILGFLFIINKSYNIPITILRYAGGKERPIMIATRGKKRIKHGVPRLVVKGYKEEVRDYLSQNYYPTVRGKYGGLILWEFEDGMLTPALPKKVARKLTPEQQKLLRSAFEQVCAATKVNFDFDQVLHNELRLKAVDDVDVEFMLQDHERIDTQYTGGWKDFIMKYGSHMTLILLAILMLAGVAIWFDKMPEFAAQCYGAARQAVEQNIIDKAVAAAAPPG